jgi:hypothetical protein
MKRPAETPPGAPIYGLTGPTVVCFLGENMETNEEKEAMSQYVPNKKMELLPLSNYLATIEGSIGSEMFRRLYAKVGDKPQDLLDNGLKSCAFFVSTVLSMPNFALLPFPNATVMGLMRSLEAKGWKKIDHYSRPGEILIWENMKQADGEDHLHAGFFWGGDEAISHVDSSRTPQNHHITFGVNEDSTPVRKIIAAYTHEFLK